MTSIEKVESFDFKISSESELSVVVDKLRNLVKSYHIFLLEGDLGTGKTTLVQHFVRSFDPSIHVTSPTFSLVQSYPTIPEVMHLDLYRLSTLEDLLNIGIEDFLYEQDVLIFIEWPEMAMELISESFVHIHISMEGDKRNIKLTVQE